MKYGICCVSVAPVRSNHDDRSEMVTQLLFGEKVEIIAEHKNWIKIMAHFDSYMGWVDPKQFLRYHKMNIKYGIQIFTHRNCLI